MGDAPIANTSFPRTQDFLWEVGFAEGVWFLGRRGAEDHLARFIDNVATLGTVRDLILPPQKMRFQGVCGRR